MTVIPLLNLTYAYVTHNFVCKRCCTTDCGRLFICCASHAGPQVHFRINGFLNILYREMVINPLSTSTLQFAEIISTLERDINVSVDLQRLGLDGVGAQLVEYNFLYFLG